MKCNLALVRPFLRRGASILGSDSPSFSYSNFVRTLSSAKNTISSQISRNSFFAATSIYASTEFNASNTSLSGRRSLCSAAEDQSKVVVVKSDAEFSNALSKAQDGSSPSVFYFTAAWCGPCRFIAPIIGELSKKYPHVTTYKIDIDEAGLSKTLSNLNVTAVPTLHFFKGGAKEAEIVGADVAKLNQLMEKLYK